GETGPQPAPDSSGGYCHARDCSLGLLAGRDAANVNRLHSSWPILGGVFAYVARGYAFGHRVWHWRDVPRLVAWTSADYGGAASRKGSGRRAGAETGGRGPAAVARSPDSSSFSVQHSELDQLAHCSKSGACGTDYGTPCGFAARLVR